jgi:hypothetical protein
MTDRPILFSASMVRALLDGRKTQTRRILKDAPTEPGWICYEAAGKRTWVGPNGYPSMPCILRFAKGDRLWVRESWAKPFAGDDGYIYRADGPEFNSPGMAKHQWGNEAPWRVSIHMPRVASRLTLAVTDVRVQRLQDISEADARAEGMPVDHLDQPYDPPPPGVDSWQGYGRYSFACVWTKLHGKDSFYANPWIVALTFTVEQRNIDA